MPSNGFISTNGFTWQDGERTIRCGRGALDETLPARGSGYAQRTASRRRALYAAAS